MAVKAFYAWAPILTLDRVKGEGFIMTIPVGDKVTKEQVGDDWSYLISSGVLRPERYPTNIRSDESPRTAKLRVINDTIKKLSEPFQESDVDEFDLGDEGVAVADD